MVYRVDKVDAWLTQVLGGFFRHLDREIIFDHFIVCSSISSDGWPQADEHFVNRNSETEVVDAI